jgi:serine/threonine protein kinase
MAVQAKPLFARYADAELIGAGVAGEVYRATDSLLGRIVAVRVLARRFNDDPTARRRFIRETLAAAPLSAHPHIVALYDVGEREGQAYAVMEYLPRGSLEARLESEGAQPPEQALAWIDQAAAALDAAHEAGVVHGDVKPSNLLLDAQDDVHVADFGAAGVTRGAYGSPAGDRRALGVVAFELLGGQRPTGAEAISRSNASLPRKLDPVFATALARDPTSGYRTCAELAASIRAAFGPTTPRADRSHVRRPLLAVLALAALGAGIWAGLFVGGGAQPARHSALTPSPRREGASIVRSTRKTRTRKVREATSTSVVHAGYCLRGQFLQLDLNQARRDSRYRGATFANFVAGQGLTCAQPPPGFVRHGFATSDLGVPPGVYPYYTSP